MEFAKYQVQDQVLSPSEYKILQMGCYGETASVEESFSFLERRTDTHFASVAVATAIMRPATCSDPMSLQRELVNPLRIALFRREFRTGWCERVSLSHYAEAQRSTLTAPTVTAHPAVAT